MMFRLGAVMTVAAAAAPWGSEELSEDSNGESRQLGWRHPFWRPKPKKLRAVVKGLGGFKAIVTAEDKGFVKWTAKIISEGSAQCDVGYNWHIHVGRVKWNHLSNQDDLDERCGSGATGGHSDDSLGCGGTTDNGAECAANYKDTPACQANETKCWAVNYAGGRCGKADKQKGCEYGDLSGKLGKILPGAEQEYFDGYIQDLDTYSRASIVLHCCTSATATKPASCSPRVACGNLKRR